MSVIDLGVRIMDVIDRHGGFGVSFVELQNEVKEIRGGPFALTNNQYKSWIYWMGVTQEAVDALRHLCTTDQLTFVPASLLVYLCDGAALQLPLVEQAREYKSDHWMPVTLARPEILQRLKAQSGARNRGERRKAGAGAPGSA